MKVAARAELNNYNQTNHTTSTYGWNSFQKTLGCCGVESYKDWNGTYFDNKTKLNKTGKVHISRRPQNFFEIFTLLLSYVVPVKSKVKILQNFVAFSEYMNFTRDFLSRHL